MREERVTAALKVLSYLVLLSMLTAMGYTCAISLIHWSGIAV
jgi:hypothetical protein